MQSVLADEELSLEQQLQNWPALSPFASRCKRIMDLTLCITLTPLALLIIGLIGICIKLSGGGPIIYRRRVIGPKGPFDAYKIRTMVADADERLQQDPVLRKQFEKNFKLKRDPRTTRIGRFLRHYSLDELPQVFNVLRGQMTMIGPRMITEAELVKYGKYGPLIRRLRPGLTGYWQVNGRQQTSYATRVEMDLYYLSHWSLWLDMRIIIKTVVNVLTAEGAY